MPNELTFWPNQVRDHVGIAAKADVHLGEATFRTWAGEETIFPRDVIEKALSHVIGNKTEQSYDRGDLFQKRRRLMEAWADFCGGAGEHDNLLELEARRL